MAFSVIAVFLAPHITKIYPCFTSPGRVLRGRPLNCSPLDKMHPLVALFEEVSLSRFKPLLHGEHIFSPILYIIKLLISLHKMLPK